MLISSLEFREDLTAAVSVGDQRLSRSELLDAAQRFAGSIPDEGPVAIHASASIDTIVAVVGCLLAGVTAVPVAPDAGPSERDHVLKDSQATVWFGPDSDGIKLPQLRVGSSADTSRRPTDSSKPALILYTSGTTGLPKGVELSSAALAAGIDGLAAAWNWSPDDTVVHGLPLFHTHGLILGVLGSLRIGSAFRHTVKAHPAAYAATAGTMYFGVPTVWSRIVRDPQSASALRGARLLVSGSAALPLTVFEQIVSLTGMRPIERYGMTETMITLSTRADGERRPGWVGLPVDGAELRIASDGFESFDPTGATVAGRLQVRGPMLFDGYLGLPTETAESWTPDGWFETGDIAARDADGFHKIVGRESTDLIKSGGYRIGAGEVEATLRDHPAVSEVTVVGLPDEELGQHVAAFVIVDEGTPLTGLEQELIDHVANQLSWHKRPRTVKFVDEFPRNAMGKVQKKLLAQ